MTGAKGDTAIAKHCVAVIGVCHAVLGFLFSFALSHLEG